MARSLFIARTGTDEKYNVDVLFASNKPMHESKHKLNKSQKSELKFFGVFLVKLFYAK